MAQRDQVGRRFVCPHCKASVAVPSQAEATFTAVEPGRSQPAPAAETDFAMPKQPTSEEPWSFPPDPDPSAAAERATAIQAQGMPTKNCPRCGEQIPARALQCKFCSKTFDGGLHQWCGIAASVLCLLAGLWMLSIHSAGSQHGEGSIFEEAFHGIGLYFIAKAFFVGPLLLGQGRRSEAPPTQGLR